MTGPRRSPYGGIPENEPGSLPPPRRRKSLRHHFCEGIEAAVKAEPSAFVATKPRTMLGLMVRELVRGAASGRCDQIKLVVFFLDEGEQRRIAAEQIAALDGNSQGNSAPQAPPEPKWDWSEAGAWETAAREDEKTSEEKEASETRARALREEHGERFRRAFETERRVRLELEREDRNAVPETAAAPSSGTISPPRTPDPHAGMMRVGGRLVER